MGTRTRFTTTAAAAALAIALLAAAAPAGAAIKHEISGSYQFQYVTSNFNNAEAVLDPGDGTYRPEGKDADATTAKFFEQRVRLGYTAKADDALRLVTKFELDYAYFGNSSYGVGPGGGGAVGSDHVNLETKHLYLDYTSPLTGVNVKAGMMEYVDPFDSTLFWGDAAGLLLSRTVRYFTFSLGYFRLLDNGEVPGVKTADLLAFDSSTQFLETGRVGISYLLLADDTGAAKTTLETVGASALTPVGPVHLSGFALYQFGEVAGAEVAAYALNAGVDTPAGPGTARLEVLYASGDADGDAKVESLQTFAGEQWYGGSPLSILTRDEYALTTDYAVLYDSGFDGQGSLVATLAYGIPVGELSAVDFALGAAWAARTADGRNRMLGTEADVKLTHEVHSGLSVVVRGAYAMLGGYFDGVAAGGATPEDLFDVRVILTYAF